MDEEAGGLGAAQYVVDYAASLAQTSLAMEVRVQGALAAADAPVSGPLSALLTCAPRHPRPLPPPQSDTGAFSIYGLSVSAGPNALAQLQALAPLLAPLGSGMNITAGGSDTGV